MWRSILGEALGKEGGEVRRGREEFLKVLGDVSWCVGLMIGVYVYLEKWGETLLSHEDVLR